jgi:Fur family transcriptional regulator, zinc uptake regulator
MSSGKDFMPNAAFPPRGHDHTCCVDDVLARADKVCARQKMRLTSQRRHILGIIASSHRAVGAYDILEQMTTDEKQPAPVTVYRALDFFMARGLVHKIASDNTYVACQREHGGEETVLLICAGCGTVGEIEAAPVNTAVAHGADKQGFVIDHQLHEVSGLCRHCTKGQ